MFQNNSKKLINDLAKQGLKKDKLRNSLIVISIIIATALVSLNMLIANSFGVENHNKLRTKQHVFYEEVTIEQVEMLEQMSEFTDTVRSKIGKISEYDGYTIKPVYAQEGNEMVTILPYEGTYPMKENEILVDKSFSIVYGGEIQLGDSLEIEFFDGNKETFVISGMTDYGETFTAQAIYTSEAYATNGSQLKDVAYSLAAQVANAENMTKLSFMETIDEIGYKVGLEKYQINPNNRFVSTLTIDMNKLMLYLGISIFIFIVSAIVIYSIFYISVINRTRELGQLRTIGATNKQIQAIIKKEGILLSFYGIPVGLAISILILLLIKPDGLETVSAIFISGFVGLAMFVTVMLSIVKPAKLAGSVSPLEASKQTIENRPSKQSKQLERKLTPLNLAIMSRKVNRKKFIMTTLSLSLTGVVFMLGATFISSYNIEKNARQGEFEFNDISISLSQNAIDLHENGKIGLLLETPFSDEFLQQIEQIDGVNGITKSGEIPVNYEYNHLRLDSHISYANPTDIELYKKYQKEFDVNYNHMVENNGIIVTSNDIYKEIYGYNFSVGDTIPISWFDGEHTSTEMFTVMAVLDVDNTSFMYEDIDAYHTQLSSGWFIVAEETFENMMIPNFDATSRVMISTDWENKGSGIVPQIEEILNDYPDIIVAETMVDRMYMAIETYNVFKILLISVMLFLGTFSTINLFNTLITNVLSRKQEFAMMQSMGLTNKQLTQVISYEGLLFAFYNILATACIGGVSGYLMVLAFESMAINYLVWSFPVGYLLAYMVVVAIVPFIISLGLVKALQKQSVVERLRDN